MTNPDETADSAAKPDGCTKAEVPKKLEDEEESKSESMSIGSPAKIPALNTPAAADDDVEAKPEAEADENMVEFKVVFNKKKYEICFGELSYLKRALKVMLLTIVETPLIYF